MTLKGRETLLSDKRVEINPGHIQNQATMAVCPFVTMAGEDSSVTQF